MEFMGIGLLELLIILFIVLVVFGPDRMIEIAREAGKYARKFQMVAAELNRQITEEMDKETKEVKDEFKEIGSEVSGELKDISDSIARDTNNHSGSGKQTNHQRSEISEKQEDLNRDTGSD